ncbi:MAG: MFS transporter [Puniceicoccaceae bacterium]
MTTPHKIRNTEKLGYALGDFSASMYYNMFMLFLLYFYTDVFGISAAAAGTMMAVTRFLDAANDPIIGILSDRTRSRWGSFRPYILWTAVPFGIIGVLTFTTPDLSDGMKLVYAYTTYMLLTVAYTCINIPYTALLGVITPNSRERTSISSYKFFLANLGGLLVQVSTLKLVDLLGGGDEARGFQLATVVFAVIAVALYFICFASTRERVLPPKDKKSSLKGDLKDLMTNRPWWILLVSGLFLLTWISIKLGSTMYYFKYYVENTSIAPAFMVTGSLAGLGGIMATGFLTRVFGKKALFMISMIGNGIFMSAMIIPQPDQVPLMFTFQTLSAFIGGPAFVLLWAMYADTADYSEWKGGRRATGLVFSAAMFSQKMGWTIGGAFAGYLLAFSGYEANVDQSAQTVMGIRLLMSVIPGVIAALGGLLILLYELDDNTMKRIESELAERRQPSPM